MQTRIEALQRTHASKVQALEQARRAAGVLEKDIAALQAKMTAVGGDALKQVGLRPSVVVDCCGS